MAVTQVTSPNGLTFDDVITAINNAANTAHADALVNHADAVIAHADAIQAHADAILAQNAETQASIVAATTTAFLESNGLIVHLGRPAPAGV